MSARAAAARGRAREPRGRPRQLFTILGAAGIGKSRLVAEFLAGLDVAVVRGRCLPYGEGITYWPVVEVLRQLEARPADEAAAAAIASLLGKSDAPAAADEIAWAVRKTLEQAAAERPLVVVLDDIHWAEPAFLDLVEHVADFSRDSPLLLLCMARPELFERRPAWSGGKPNATTVLLEPLSPEEADELLGQLARVDDAFRDRIRGAAGGNPLFLEEMARDGARVGRAARSSCRRRSRALLAARLDQLEPSERAVLQRGAVEGEVFHRGAVEALAPDEDDAPTLLLGLVRKELVRPDRGRRSRATRRSASAICCSATPPTTRSRSHSGPGSTSSSPRGSTGTASRSSSSTSSSATTSSRPAATATSSASPTTARSRPPPGPG